jgi:hypothetical protein
MCFMCYKVGRPKGSGLSSGQTTNHPDRSDVPPPALIRAGLEALPALVRAAGARASRRFIEFFTASIRNRNTRMAYARAVKRFFAWCDERRLELHAENAKIADCLAERGRFEPPRPFRILSAEFVPSLAHHSARKKSIRAEENLFARDSALLRISPVPLVRYADARKGGIRTSGTTDGTS